MQNFSELYLQYYSPVYTLIRKLLGDNALSADLTQDVFMVLYQELAKNKTIQYPKTWLYKVAVNKSVNYINRKRIQFTINEQSETILQVPENIPDFDMVTKKNILDKALNKLRQDERTVIILYSEGLTYKEIAEISNVPFNSIGKMISRTLEKLKQQLKDKKYELLND